jgi:Flp pilus assembly protein TadD
MGAVAHYEQAVKADPALGDDVYLRLGEIALERADEAGAIRHLRRALQLNPQNAEVRAHLESLSALP